MYPVHKNRHLRRGLIALLILACLSLATLFLYLQALPEITVVNRGDQVIDAVVVELPSSRVAFDAIEPGEQSTIFHSSRQTDGVYSYRIHFSSGASLAGQCGYVTSSEFGKRLDLIIQSPSAVECQESQSLF